jgi:hypothetical protein
MPLSIATRIKEANWEAQLVSACACCISTTTSDPAMSIAACRHSNNSLERAVEMLSSLDARAALEAAAVSCSAGPHADSDTTSEGTVRCTAPQEVCLYLLLGNLLIEK